MFYTGPVLVHSLNNPATTDFKSVLVRLLLLILSAQALAKFKWPKLITRLYILLSISVIFLAIFTYHQFQDTYWNVNYSKS